MTKRRARATRWAWAFAAFAASVCAADETLRLGDVVERQLAAGGSDRYILEIGAGDVAALELAERNADVALVTTEPGGRVLEDFTPQSRQDVSYPRFLVDASGVLRMEVANRSTVDGAYTLKLTALHSAAERDVEGVRAHEAWRRAVSLATKDTPESLRAALEAYAEAARRFEASGETGQRARALLRMGRMQYLLHDRNAALATYELALPLYREVNDQRGEAALLINIGSVYQAMAEPTLALQRFERAAAVFRADGDAYRTATALHNLGWVHHSLGEFKEAGRYYREALALWPAAGNKVGEAQTTHSLGMLYFDLGQPERSREYFEAALARRRAIGDHPGEAQSLANLGAVFAATNERARAREAFAEALAAARATEDKVEEAAALLGLAAMNESGGDSALHLLEALAIAREVKDRRREAVALQRLGDWRLSRGEHASALTHYMAALALQRAAGDPRGEAESLLSLARLQRETGALAEARDWAEQAVLKVESVRGRVVQPDLRASYFATVQSYYDVYIDASMRLHAQDPGAGYDVAALQASERARARSLLDRLIEQQADLLADVDATLIERERERRRALNAKDLRWRTLLSESAGETQVRAARIELDRALDALREVEGELRARSPRYAELTQRDPVSLDALRADLGADSALLEYWLGEERSYLWVITDERTSSHVLPPGADLEALARKYFAAVSARRPQSGEASVARMATALSTALLPSAAAEHADERRLVVVSHGALEYLPFGALPDARATDEPWLRTREVVNLPSASVLHALRAYRTRAPPARMIAVFGDPVFARDDPRLSRVASATHASKSSEDELQRSAADAGLGRLRRLRFSRIEANAISALAPASARFAALDFEANRAAALSPALAEYRIVHFATHGLINSVHPELSGLAFSAFDEQGGARDSLVRLHDIYGMSLQADLVVLSACRTALGPAVKGEGLVGLTRGFMYAGAPRVLATLWSVDDAATAHAMTRFYKELLVNERKPADALRRAQLAMLDDPRWSAPYYWGGFVLQGDWR